MDGCRTLEVVGLEVDPARVGRRRVAAASEWVRFGAATGETFRQRLTVRPRDDGGVRRLGRFLVAAGSNPRAIVSDGTTYPMTTVGPAAYARPSPLDVTKDCTMRPSISTVPFLASAPNPDRNASTKSSPFPDFAVAANAFRAV